MQKNEYRAEFDFILEWIIKIAQLIWMWAKNTRGIDDIRGGGASYYT